MTKTAVFRGTLCLLLCALMATSLLFSARAAASFPDLENHWAAEAADWCFQQGLMNGLETGNFLPDAPMTRAMLVTVLYRLAGSPGPERTSPEPDETPNSVGSRMGAEPVVTGFGDVPAGSWYAAAVAWATENSIVTGYTPEYFAPEADITREQLSTILYRYARHTGRELPDFSVEILVYQDHSEISDWALEAVAWATAEGLMGNHGAGCFSPGENAVRAEVATVLYRYVTGENLAEPCMPATARVPILLYHHVADQGDPSTTISAAVLESHLQAILEAGYTPVSLSQLRDFVQKGKALPEKPVCITFDDGYASNYSLAYPLLLKYRIPAAIFVVGIHMGAETYRDTDIAITPHFTYEQAREMLDSGLVDIQSHTYDMHRWAAYETETPVRVDALRLPTESLTHYQNFLAADFTRSAGEIQDATGHEVTCLAYPGGCWNEESEAVLRSLGVEMTLTTREGAAQLTHGDPDCLYTLPRNTIYGSMSAQTLLQRLEAMA